MDPISGGIVAAIPLLSLLFGGGGGSGNSPGINPLFSDPQVLAQLKHAMFGIQGNGAEDFYGGLLGQQYKEAQDKAPLQAAITRMAGMLLPKAYQPGVITGLGGVNSDGMPPILQKNGTTDGPNENVRLSPPPLNLGSGGADGRDPGGSVFGKQTLAPPSYAQLLARMQGNG